MGRTDLKKRIGFLQIGKKTSADKRARGAGVSNNVQTLLYGGADFFPCCGHSADLCTRQI
jgi:hypothetical protein